MKIAIDKIIESFPHTSITRICGLPTCDFISAAHLQLNSNAASIHSHRGNGKLGLLFLTLKLEVYNTLSTIEFIPPVNPGPEPIIPDSSTGPAIAEIRRAHQEQYAEYLQYDQVDKALKSILIAAVDEAYIRSLRHKYVGFANVTTLQIITHLYDTYARITANDLKENDKNLHLAYDSTAPFENLVDQIENAVDFASAGKSPYTPKQIVTAAYNLTHETGAYNADCKDWRAISDVDQTWDNFKTFFCKAHHDLRESQLMHDPQVTAASYQANNATQDNDTFVSPPEADALEAIANLAIASSEDKNTINTLTATNASLVQQLVSLRAELANCRRSARTKNQSFTHYCWTHGTSCNHKSENCHGKKDGHKLAATAENKMNGETRRFRSF